MSAALIASHPSTFAQTLWIGTAATTPETTGIYRTTLDDTTGQLAPLTRAATLQRATFVAVSPDQKLLLAVSESSSIAANGMRQRDGRVASFRINPDSSLTALNNQPSGGLGPCHVTLDETARVAFVSNYHDASLASFRILPDGQLQGPVTTLRRTGSGPHPKRQLLAHVHSARVLPGNRHVAFCELGADQISVFAFDPATAELTEHSAVKLPPGTGPRHMVIHPTRPLAFVVNELNQSVAALALDSARGELRVLQTLSSRPDGSPAIDAREMTSAEIRLHPNGRILYTSTRDLTDQKRDYLSVFALDEKNHLTLVEQHAVAARVPRGFHVSPSGKWLVLGGQQSTDLAVLAIDSATGKLSPHAEPIPCPSPIGLNFGHP